MDIDTLNTWVRERLSENERLDFKRGKYDGNELRKVYSDNAAPGQAVSFSESWPATATSAS